MIAPAWRVALRLALLLCLTTTERQRLDAQPPPAEPPTASRAEALDRAGEAAHQAGELATAIRSFREAAGLWRELGARKEEARSLLSLGWSQVFSGEFAAGIPVLESALGIARELADPGLEAQVLDDLGLAHRASGELHEALANFAAGLPLARTAGAAALEAELHANSGLVHADLGELEKALGEHDLALATYRAAGDKRGEGQALGYIGSIHSQLGEPEKALASYRPALAALRSIGHVWQAAILNRMGTAHRQLGQLQEALHDHEAALAVWRERHQPWGEAMSLAEIAGLHTTLGEPDRALGELATALEISRAQNDRPRIAGGLELQGVAHLVRGVAASARDDYRQAAELWQALGNPRRQAGALAGLARAERSSGHLEAARTRIEEALAILENLRRNFLSDELRATYLASVREYYELYLDLLLELDGRAPPSGDTAGTIGAAGAAYAPDASTSGTAGTALEACEESRARVLLDLLARTRIDPDAALPSELRKRRDVNTAAISSTQGTLLALRSRSPAGSPRLAELDGELDRLLAARDRLDGEIRHAAPGYADLTLPQPLTAAAIRELLPADTALLEYFLGADRSFLIVATGAGVQAFRLPPEKEIVAVVDRLREGLSSPSRARLPGLLAEARRLYLLLVEPAATTLEAYPRWVISPDGALAQLPFEVLLTKEMSPDLTGPQPYLLRSREVRYVPSASVLAHLLTPTGAPPRDSSDVPPLGSETALLAFGDPEYGKAGESGGSAVSGPMGPVGPVGAVGELVRAVGRQGGWRFSRLEASGREVTQIARLFAPGTSQVFLRGQAREENVKRRVAGLPARRWHFAAHALIDDERPEESGIVLSLDDDPAEDGILQVREIFGLRLPADLVVLSACETATGREVRGEGILGLTRAFLHAGARGLVASLWQVEDRSTADLMVRFYRGLRDGADAAGALRQAKLDLLNKGDSLAHPFYWAPFVLTGAAR